MHQRISKSQLHKAAIDEVFLRQIKKKMKLQQLAKIQIYQQHIAKLLIKSKKPAIMQYHQHTLGDGCTTTPEIEGIDAIFSFCCSEAFSLGEDADAFELNNAGESFNPLNDFLLPILFSVSALSAFDCLTLALNEEVCDRPVVFERRCWISLSANFFILSF